MLDEYLKRLLCDRIFGLGAIGINEIRAGVIADGGNAAAFEIVYHLGTGWYSIFLALNMSSYPT